MLFLLNGWQGRTKARLIRNRIEAFVEDVRAGVPISILVEHYVRRVFFSNADAGTEKWMADSLRLLRRAEFSPFRQLQDDPAYQEIPLTMAPVAQGQMIWDHGIGYGPGRDASLSITLKRPQRVYAIRLRYFYDNPPETLEAFQLTWKPGDPA